MEFAFCKLPTVHRLSGAMHPCAKQIINDEHIKARKWGAGVTPRDPTRSHRGEDESLHAGGGRRTIEKGVAGLRAAVEGGTVS